MGVWWWRDVAAAVDGCVQLLWRQIGFSLSEPHNQSLSSPIPTTPTHSSPVILSLFDLLQLRTQSLQCCSKPEKRFDPLFIMLLTPVSGYNGIQHIWGGTISVTSNWRPEPGMYCCRHKLSALPSKQMVMMDKESVPEWLPKTPECLTGHDHPGHHPDDRQRVNAIKPQWPVDQDMIKVMIMISNQYTLCNTQAWGIPHSGLLADLLNGNIWSQNFSLVCVHSCRLLRPIQSKWSSPHLIYINLFLLGSMPFPHFPTLVSVHRSSASRWFVVGVDWFQLPRQHSATGLDY